MTRATALPLPILILTLMRMLTSTDDAFQHVLPCFEIRKYVSMLENPLAIASLVFPLLRLALSSASVPEFCNRYFCAFSIRISNSESRCSGLAPLAFFFVR